MKGKIYLKKEANILDMMVLNPVRNFRKGMIPRPDPDYQKEK